MAARQGGRWWWCELLARHGSCLGSLAPRQLTRDWAILLFHLIELIIALCAAGMLFLILVFWIFVLRWLKVI